MSKRTLLRCLGPVTGLLLALAGSAQARPSDDETTFRQPYPLSDTTRFAVQGRHVTAASGERSGDSTCRLPAASLSLAPHERAVELRQVSLNRRTCRAVFERGVPPRRAKMLPAGEKQAGGERSSRGAGAGVSAQARTYRFGGYSKAWYTDARTGDIVTSVTAGADWNPSGGCIGTNNIFFRATADRDTGWDLESHRWSYIDDICRYLVSSVNAHFRDPRFRGCQGGPGPVDSYYNRVRFVGYPDGGMRGGRTSRTEPSCRNVLIAYLALYRR